MSERLITYVDGAEAGMWLCLTTDHQVEILGVELDAPDRSLFRPTEVTAAPWNTTTSRSDPVLDRTTLDPDGPGLSVTIKGRLADCEDYGAGTRLSFDSARVRFRYRGHNRSTAVSLNDVYTFISPADDHCPRPRAGS